MAQNLVFSQEEFDSRYTRLQQLLAASNLEALFVHTPENIFYLTGYQSPGYYMYQCLIVPQSGQPILVPRAGEISNVQTYSWLSDEQMTPYDDTNDPVSVTVDSFKGLHLPKGKIGVELGSWFLPVQNYQKLVGKLQDYQMVNAQGTVEKLRLIKSEAEIVYIREACKVADESMRAGLDAIKVGINEDEVAAAMFTGMMRAGGEYLGMEPFVSSGYRSGNMHAAWGHKIICKDETILMELAGARNRYHGAIMRSAYTGKPTDEIKRITDVCIRSLQAAIDIIRPGVTSGEVDDACRGVIERAGLFNLFRKRTGYSIGIAFAPDWGEGHIMSLQRDDPKVLKEGMVFHMPPAIRLPNHYGIGFSHTVLVTKDGCEPLTQLDCSLRLID
ncbi:MAG: Xaa-Pro peptidase family protein [Sporolactobacillus sp.]